MERGLLFWCDALCSDSLCQTAGVSQTAEKTVPLFVGIINLCELTWFHVVVHHMNVDLCFISCFILHILNPRSKALTTRQLIGSLQAFFC
jgi:hypothetical protein